MQNVINFTEIQFYMLSECMYTTHVEIVILMLQLPSVEFTATRKCTTELHNITQQQYNRRYATLVANNRTSLLYTAGILHFLN